MLRTEEIREGMTVRTLDGEKLGKILSIQPSFLIVEKGLFFPKDYEVPIELASEVREGDLWLSATRDEFRADEGYVGGRASLGATSREASAGESWRAGEEARIPLAEEELEARKLSREAGEVRVRKDVVTEKRSIDVPVTREEVHVERVPASASAQPGEGAFEEKTISVPVHEEEVEVTKRPRVREELRVSKTSKQQEQRVEGEVRREEARVDRTDDQLRGRGEPEPD